jgi:TetR/AcrR family fatty acid metabolism transcriptional regulator
MPRRVDKSAKRMDILKAAADVFARDGFANTKIADVAERAGIGKGTVYEYFSSKDKLFLELCKDLIEWPKPAPSSADPMGDLERTIEALFKSYEGSRDFFRILVEYWSIAIRDKSAHSAMFLARGEDFYEGPRRLITHAVRQGQKSGAFNTQWSAERVGEIILAVIEGLRLRRMLDPRVSLPEDFAVLFDMLRAALMSPQPAAKARRPKAKTARRSSKLT